ncbi:MAG: hypothetical protein Q8N13_19900 [Acidovorax sp.]|nr:hypothetical protein [Acidovorax sp.]
MQTSDEEQPQSSLDKGLTQTGRTSSQVAAIAPTRRWLWVVSWLLPIVAVVAYSLYVQDLNRRTAEADRLVDELCEKYAGITVYEQVEAPAHYFRSHMPGEPPITPHLVTYITTDPYVYAPATTTLILAGNPHRTGYPTISIREIPIIRRNDGAVLSKSTDVEIVGGDHLLETLLLDLSPSPMRSNRRCTKHVGGSHDEAAAVYTNSPPYHSKLFPKTHASRITYELRAKTR